MLPSREGFLQPLKGQSAVTRADGPKKKGKYPVFRAGSKQRDEGTVLVGGVHTRYLIYLDEERRGPANLESEKGEPRRKYDWNSILKQTAPSRRKRRWRGDKDGHQKGETRAEKEFVRETSTKTVRPLPVKEAEGGGGPKRRKAFLSVGGEIAPEKHGRGGLEGKRKEISSGSERGCPNKPLYRKPLLAKTIKRRNRKEKVRGRQRGGRGGKESYSTVRGLLLVANWRESCELKVRKKKRLPSVRSWVR